MINCNEYSAISQLILQQHGCQDREFGNYVELESCAGNYNGMGCQDREFGNYVELESCAGNYNGMGCQDWVWHLA